MSYADADFGLVMLSGTRPFAIADGLVESKHPYLNVEVGME